MAKQITRETPRYGEAPYQHIQAELKKRIHRGHWAKGALIPSRRALADEFQVSVPTIQKAITDMILEGLLRVEAKRTFVFGDPDKPLTPQAYSAGIGLNAGPVQDSMMKSSSNRTVALIGNLKPAESRLIANIWHLVMLDEAGQALAQYGFSSQFFNQYSTQGKPEALISSILLERPAAVIAHTSAFGSEPSNEYMRPLMEAGIPVVLVGSSLIGMTESLNSGTASAIVAYDLVNEGHQVAKHLIEQGCRRLLFFSPYQAEWVLPRLEGARNACRAAGLPPDSIEMLFGPEDIEVCVSRYPYPDEHFLSAFDLAQERLQRDWNIDGVIAVNDEIACGFRSAAEKVGLKPGVDFLLAGFDDRHVARDLQLTTMHPPFASMGREAARAMAMILQGQDNLSVAVMKSRLVVRESTRRHFEKRRTEQ